MNWSSRTGGGAAARLLACARRVRFIAWLNSPRVPGSPTRRPFHGSCGTLGERIVDGTGGAGSRSVLDSLLTLSRSGKSPSGLPGRGRPSRLELCLCPCAEAGLTTIETFWTSRRRTQSVNATAIRKAERQETTEVCMEDSCEKAGVSRKLRAEFHFANLPFNSNLTG